MHGVGKFFSKQTRKKTNTHTHTEHKQEHRKGIMQMFISSIHSVGIQLFNDMHAILGLEMMKTCEASFFVRAKSICILKNLHLIPALAERHQDDAWENRWSPFSTCRKENVLSGLMVLSAKKNANLVFLATNVKRNSFELNAWYDDCWDKWI